MITRRARHFRSIVLHAVLVFASAPAVGAPDTAPTSETPREARALVVLIGDAGQEPALVTVLSELLERQGVVAEFVTDDHFEPNAVLGERGGDSRVGVFVVSDGARSARLYFRGPGGERFLLRELALSNGLDEIGRELIAQVVETSTLALLRGAAGISREQARADLARQASPEDAPVKPGAEETRVDAPEPRTRIEALLGARGASAFAGGDLGFSFGGGLEGGASLRVPSGMLSRIRVVGELWSSQTIRTERVEATVTRTSFLGGIDAGVWANSNALLFGLSAGVDITRIAPTVARDQALSLADDSTSNLPILRTELRYEFTYSTLMLTLSTFGQVLLLDTHYDVLDDGRRLRVAEPWPVQPGIVVTIGFRPTLAGS